MRRRGVTVLELSISILLVAVVMSGIAALLSSLAVHRRESQRRTTAIQEAANHIERISTLPWNQVTSSVTADWTLSNEAASSLPSGTLAIHVAEADVVGDAGAARGRRVAVEITWRNAAGAIAEPVRIVTWRFPEEAPR